MGSSRDMRTAIVNRVLRDYVEASMTSTKGAGAEGADQRRAAAPDPTDGGRDEAAAEPAVARRLQSVTYIA